MLNQIPQQNVVDMVFDEIMRHIVSGEWKIGDKIPSENELATQLQVSRNSLRQALNRFNALGIIESRHGDGSYVRPVDLVFYLKVIFPMVILGHYDALNVYQLNRAIQNEAARCVCALATKEQEQELLALVDEMRRCDEANDQAAFLAADMRFHEVIVECGRNPVLISIEQCVNKILAGPLYEVSSQALRKDSIFMHAKIAQGVQARNESSVRDWMAAHMSDIVGRLEKSNYNRTNCEDKTDQLSQSAPTT